MAGTGEKGKKANKTIENEKIEDEDKEKLKKYLEHEGIVSQETLKMDRKKGFEREGPTQISNATQKVAFLLQQAF